jgi:hypothetical protein
MRHEFFFTRARQTTAYADEGVAHHRFETWGKKILGAVEEQGRLLAALAEGGRNGLHQQRPDQLARLLDMDGENLETMSRKDTPWTPITGSDMILGWSVFPQERPVSTFPATEFAEKPKPSDLGMFQMSLYISARRWSRTNARKSA